MDQSDIHGALPDVMPFFVVGIGASAGGLSAINAFFQHLPKDCPHAFVVVQHLADDYKSMMPELLGNQTQLPVQEVTNELLLQSGHVYLIPPGHNIAFDNHTSSGADRRFILSPKTPKPGLNLPIDFFLTSLAQVVRSRAIGIILSGTGSDGSRGIQAIKAHDGIVFVQDPRTAEFRGMPDAAIETQMIDFISAPDEMPNEIERYIGSIHSGSRGIELALEKHPKTLDRIISCVNEHTNADFSGYKRQMIKRRIAKRMSLLKLNDINTYLNQLTREKEERKRLAQDFLVGVTYFFRDPAAWDLVANDVIPKLIDKERQHIKVWSAGCSTGEEAYTIAILIDEYCKANDINCSVSIFATDMDRRAIEFAQRGVYPASIEEYLDPERLEKYFSRCTEGYEVKPVIRNTIIFSEHNLLDSPPFIQVDLLVCRNLLIYLTTPLQQNLMAMFEFSLKRSGILLLGPSETVGTFENRFDVINKTWRLYSNRKLPSSKIHVSRRYPAGRQTFGLTLPDRRSYDSVKTEYLSSMLKAAFADEKGCCLIIDEGFHLIESVGPYQKFLKMPKESFSNNVLDMVPERVRVALSLCLRKAQTQEGDAQTNVEVDHGDMIIPVSVSITPVGASINEVTPRYALLIRETSPPKPVTQDETLSTDDHADTKTYIQELELQLQNTQTDLKNTIEDLQSSNEELQTTNEELLSSNEELQSTYEEMQSVNEELHTVNSEFQLKNSELMALNADMNNLLNSTEVAVLFVDTAGKIRKFTPAIGKLFDLRDSDLGRPIKHFMPNIDPDSGIKLMNAILADGQTIEMFETITPEGTWFLVKVTPFFDATSQAQGKVITFIQIHELKEAKRELERKTLALEQVLESASAGYWDWIIENDYEYMSPTLKSMLGYTDDEMENRPLAWQNLMHPDDLPVVLDSLNAHVSSQGKTPYIHEVRYFHKNGDVVWVLRTGKVIEWGTDQKPVRMVGCHVNITNAKTAEAALKARAEEAQQLTYIAAHDLREPLNTILSFIDLLTDDATLSLQGEHLKTFEFIQKATQRLDVLVTDLLSYSQLQTTTVDKHPIQLLNLLRTLTESMQPSIQSQEGEVRLEINEDIEIEASPAMMTRLFQNLINNGLKFHLAGRPPKLVIRAEQTLDHIVIHVQDNGIGIEDPYQEKIFSLFYRLHTKSEYEGTGVGLAICKKIVALHYGSLNVSSTAGIGSTFTVKLPIVKERRSHDH